jgi:hypothetical protein
LAKPPHTPVMVFDWASEATEGQVARQPLSVYVIS